MPYLICVSGPNVENEWPVGGETVMIGRQRDNSVLLYDGRASREHCRIFKEGKQYFLEDLTSTNGTFVNGRKIVGSVPLTLETTFQVGESLLFFSSSSISDYAEEHTDEIDGSPRHGEGYRQMMAIVLRRARERELYLKKTLIEKIPDILFGKKNKKKRIKVRHHRAKEPEGPRRYDIG